MIRDLRLQQLTYRKAKQNNQLIQKEPFGNGPSMATPGLSRSQMPFSAFTASHRQKFQLFSLQLTLTHYC